MVRKMISVSVLAACCFAGPASAAVSENTAREAFEAVTKRFESAYNAGNPAGIADLFATGGVYLTPGGTMLKTRQEIETAIGGRIKTGWTKETVTVIDAHPAGDDVWGIGEYTIAGTGQNSGKQIGGNFAVVLTHEGSDWHFRLLIGNLKPTQDVTGMTAPATR